MLRLVGQRIRNGQRLRLYEHRPAVGAVLATGLLLALLQPFEARAEKIPRSTGLGELLIVRREAAPQTLAAQAKARDEQDQADAAPDSPRKDDAPQPDYVRFEPERSSAEIVKDLFPEDQPTLHIHLKYFDGVKEYQGPLVEGGRTAIIASDPVTGCRRASPAIPLPPGTPVIVYQKTSITYVYPDRRIIFLFEGDDSCQIQVFERPGIGVERVLTRTVTELDGKIKEKATQSPLTESVKTSFQTARDTARGAYGSATTMASHALDKAGEALSALPVLKMLKSVGEDVPSRAQTEQLRQQGLQDARDARQYLPTLR